MIKKEDTRKELTIYLLKEITDDCREKWQLENLNPTGYGLDDRMIGFRFPAGAGNFSLRHHVHTGSEAQPASYSMGARGTFPAGKAAGSWSWPHTSI